MTVRWEDFAHALRKELTQLPLEAVLIIARRDDDLHFVQFMQEADNLYGETGGGEYGDPIGSLTVRDRELLTAAGWREPGPDDEVPTWAYRLPWPATSGEYRGLTGAVVTALRDVRRIAAPTDLIYRSWELNGRRRAVRLPGVEPDEGYAVDD